MAWGSKHILEYFPETKALLGDNTLPEKLLEFLKESQNKNYAQLVMEYGINASRSNYRQIVDHLARGVLAISQEFEIDVPRIVIDSDAKDLSYKQWKDIETVEKQEIIKIPKVLINELIGYKPLKATIEIEVYGVNETKPIAKRIPLGLMLEAWMVHEMTHKLQSDYPELITKAADEDLVYEWRSHTLRSLRKEYENGNYPLEKLKEYKADLYYNDPHEKDAGHMELAYIEMRLQEIEEKTILKS